jgi:hypothetical protein
MYSEREKISNWISQRDDVGVDVTLCLSCTSIAIPILDLSDYIAALVVYHAARVLPVASLIGVTRVVLHFMPCNTRVRCWRVTQLSRLH